MAIAVSPQTGYRLSCLGPVSLTGPDGLDLGLRTRKLFALLLVLSRQAGKPISRDTLIELLWSEDSEKKARHSLSQSVSLINKAFGIEAIAGADRDRVLLKPGALVVDAAEFERLAADGEYVEASKLWRGGLLEGVWIQRAPHFERWLADERSRLDRVRRRLAHEIIEERRADGDYQGMRAEAEALLEMDALDEKAMLAWLQALQLGGDRTQALRRYSEFEKRLKEELDAEPGSALRGWARRNRKGDSEAGLRYVPIPRVAETSVLPSPQPMFGRTEEFALLWNAWEQAKTGKGSFIILEGEAGIGKTALATKLANQVHVEGASVAFVRCYRAEKSVPFAPVTQLTRQLSRLPGFVGLDPVWIGELSRVVPELRERYPNAPQPMAVDDAARHRLSDATTQASIAVADEQPLLIVVDDLQDADEATLASLHYLARHASYHPIVEIVVRRSSPSVSEMERAFLETARSGGFGRFVQLQSLDDQHIQRLALHLLARSGMEPDSISIVKIVMHAKGNPLHAIEAALATSREARTQEPSSGAHELPDTFDDLVADRLQRMSQEAKTIARTMAAGGRPLTGYEVAAGTGLALAELSAGVAELEEAQFLRRTGSGLTFAHERYAKIAELSTPEGKARDLHIRLARLLARSAASNPAARIEVARHFELGGDCKRARAHAIAAASFATSLGAVRERANALELLVRVSPKPPEGAVGDLGECYLTMNDQERLLSLCATQADIGRSDRDTLQYLAIAARAQSGQALPAESRDALTTLLARCPLERRFRPSAQMLLMRIADKTGDYGLVRATARKIRAEGANRPPTSYALLAAAYVGLKYYLPARMLPLLRRALAASQEEHNLATEQLCRDGLGIALNYVGKFRESVTQLEYSLALARKTLNPLAEAAALQNRAVAEMNLGELHASMRSLEDADRLYALYPRWPFSTYNVYNRSIVQFLSGEFAAATEGFRASLALAEAIQHRDMQAESLACLAITCTRRADWRGARDWAERLDGMSCGGGFASWAEPAARAWRLVLDGNHQEGLSLVTKEARRLARREVPHWLQLEAERVLLLEFISGRREETCRERVRSLAQRFEARGLEAAVM